MQTMWQYAKSLCEMAEWVMAVEDTLVWQVRTFADTPDLVTGNSNRENFDFNRNLDF